MIIYVNGKTKKAKTKLAVRLFQELKFSFQAPENYKNYILSFDAFIFTELYEMDIYIQIIQIKG